MSMSSLIIVIAVIAVALMLFGGFVPSIQWLLWVGIVLLVIAVIVWLMRSMSGRKSV